MRSKMFALLLLALTAGVGSAGSGFVIVLGSGILWAGAVLAQPNVAPGISLESAYPGGNVKVLSIDEKAGVVRLEPDLRDTEGHWFHFDFTVRGAAGRTLKFRFPQDGNPYLSSLGPAICRDGVRWTWLNADGKRHEPDNAFDYTFGKSDDNVRFAVSIPYAQRDWGNFTAKWRTCPHVKFDVLCKSQSGRRDVELLRVPAHGKPEWLFVFTARHHACETTGNPPMEGVLLELMSGSVEGRWAREHADFLFVPFMDKDGVEEGDQGKNRRPWDYNRDYAKGRYTSVRALKELIVRESVGKKIVFFDLHSPYVRSFESCPEQDQVFTFGTLHEELRSNWERFRSNWKTAQSGGTLRYDGRYDIQAGQGYWNVMKKAWDSGLLASDPWVRTLPNAYLATCCEFGYSLCGGVNSREAMRELGASLLKAAVRTVVEEKVAVDGRTPEAAGAKVTIAENGDVRVWATNAISTVTLSWEADFAPTAKVLGDAWERTYGDTYWRGICEKRDMPWYFLLNDGEQTEGWGVETGPGAMCCWEVTTNATTLVLDLRAGGQPVQLGGRTLTACRIVRAASREGESAWDFGRRFCRMMCPKPKLPKAPVYGYNDWYCAYGKNTATNFLADAAYIMECAKGCANPPYVVMDDGWQKNAPPVVHESGRGPWDAAGPNFGMDMPTFCGRIAALGAKPGLWYRPLRAWDELPDEQRLLANRDYLDPTVPAVKARIVEDVRRFRDWGFKLVKIDFLSYDLAQLWPCDPHPHCDRYIQDDRAWRDSSRTTAEVMRDLYQAMKDAAGDDVVIIGCNAFNHLAAGVFELQRTGNDTSGKKWSWTRDHGVNTLAMRSIQDGAFFKIDADCVGLAEKGAVPWDLNRQWMDLLGRSGTPFFVSWRRQLAGPEVRKALAEAFRRASSDRPIIEALDWQEVRTPNQWRDVDGTVSYDWEI